VASDGKWLSSDGAIRFCEIYHGETVDAREDKKGWSSPLYNAAGWVPVKAVGHSLGNLVAGENEPVRKHETFRPVNIFTTPKGEQVIDFGQNLVGWVKIKASGNSGDSIVIRHAEVLDKSGNFYTENLRAARATATYILRGGGVEEFEPHFTFYGFRYIQLVNYPGTLKSEQVEAVALYSDMPPTGTFTSSHPLINQLQHNIQWGQRGNFLDVPTDCPQRDERLGWTGDAQAFSRTAAFNFDVRNFFSKWLKDVAADQLPNGSVPFVIPNVLGEGAAGSTGWADAATIIPWNMYLAYGDPKILDQQYASMKAWVGYMQSHSKEDLWNTGFHFGDWLFYRPFDDNDGRSAVTDKYLIAQCFYAHSTQILINTARVLGKQDDLRYYENLLSRIKNAFVREYITPNGRLISGTQTAYVLALNFDMLPEPLRAQAADRLVENIKSYDTHLSTGFLGTPYLCHVLTRFGKDDMAYQLLLQESYPSWLYPVKMGATTIWERWNGIRTDSSFEPASMNSFNHYAYGAIGDWMYRSVAGLDTDGEGPGYKRIRIQPHIGKGLDHAAASLHTPYGLAESKWSRQNGRLTRRPIPGKCGRESPC
jgi:alpha-L-rhamnosidase